MLNIQQIITQADLLVPNTVLTTDKIDWLNNINADFFTSIKLPKIHRFATTISSTYTLPSDAREKNIDLVKVGLLTYRDGMSESARPLQNTWTFDDSARVLTLTPAPYLAGLSATVRYHRIATTTFTVGNLNAVPDAPEEYHWTYVPALCVQICLSMDDPKATAFAAQHSNAWSAAAANYRGPS